MSETGPLERIARKEQEIRARMLAACAQADDLVARAEREAAALLAEAEKSADADARALVERELGAARAAADELVAAAVAEASALGARTSHAERAVELVVAAVLAREPDGVGALARGGRGT